MSLCFMSWSRLFKFVHISPIFSEQLWRMLCICLDSCFVQSAVWMKRYIVNVPPALFTQCKNILFPSMVSEDVRRRKMNVCVECTVITACIHLNCNPKHACTIYLISCRYCPWISHNHHINGPKWRTAITATCLHCLCKITLWQHTQSATVRSS